MLIPAVDGCCSMMETRSVLGFGVLVRTIVVILELGWGRVLSTVVPKKITIKAPNNRFLFSLITVYINLITNE